MSVVTYHYKVFKSLQVPIITLAISYGDTWYPVEAYVDSGATYSVFTARVADRLGLTYRTGQRKFVQVGDGAFIPVYLHDLKIQLGKHRLVVPVIGTYRYIQSLQGLLRRTALHSDTSSICLIPITPDLRRLKSKMRERIIKIVMEQF